MNDKCTCYDCDYPEYACQGCEWCRKNHPEQCVNCGDPATGYHESRSTGRQIPKCDTHLDEAIKIDEEHSYAFSASPTGTDYLDAGEYEGADDY
jgi:hypothetical protein